MTATPFSEVAQVESYIPANPGYVLHSIHIDDSTLKATAARSPIVGWRVSELWIASPIALHGAGYDWTTWTEGSGCRYAHLVETPDHKFFDGEDEFASVAHWITSVIECRKSELARLASKKVEANADPLA